VKTFIDTLAVRERFRDRYWDEHYFGLLRDEWRGRDPDDGGR